MTDRIRLTGVRARGHHGVLASERAAGQDFVVDVELELQLGAAAAGDDLARTVHYGELAEEIVAAVERDPVDLIETVAERIAGLVLAYPPVERVTVTVHKPDAPITVPFADVAVTIERARSHRAVVAVGANLGDREATIRAALADLGDTDGIEVVAVSPLVESVALTDHGPDADRPGYLNGVALVRSELRPRALLALLLEVERAHGRTRETHWGDRTLDLDLIDVDGGTMDEPGLVLPHPRAAERDFVLGPWLAVDPDATLGGTRVDALMRALR